MLVCLALGARLALFSFGPAHDLSRANEKDSTAYWSLASTLWRTGDFAKSQDAGVMERVVGGWRQLAGMPPRADVHGRVPESFRTPGYPFFLAVLSGGGAHRAAVLIVQNVLGAMCAGCVFLLAVHIGVTRSAATVAALIFALHPALITYDNLFLSESLFDALCVFALLCCASSRPMVAVLGAGALFGAASLVRPPLGLVMIPLGLVFSWKASHNVRRCLAIVLIAIVPVAAWMVRNARAGEGWRLTTVGDYNMVFYHAPCVVSESIGRECTQDWATELHSVDARMRSHIVAGRDPLTAARSLAFRDIAGRPKAFATVIVKSELKLLVSHSLDPLCRLLGIAYHSTGAFSRIVLRESTVAARGSSAFMAIGLAWTAMNVVLVLAGGIGLIRAFASGERVLAIALCLTALVFAAAAGSLGSERFRLPVMAPLAIAVAFAWEPHQPGVAVWKEMRAL